MGFPKPVFALSLVLSLALVACGGGAAETATDTAAPTDAAIDTVLDTAAVPDNPTVPETVEPPPGCEIAANTLPAPLAPSKVTTVQDQGDAIGIRAVALQIFADAAGEILEMENIENPLSIHLGECKTIESIAVDEWKIDYGDCETHSGYIRYTGTAFLRRLDASERRYMFWTASEGLHFQATALLPSEMMGNFQKHSWANDPTGKMPAFVADVVSAGSIGDLHGAIVVTQEQPIHGQVQKGVPIYDVAAPIHGHARIVSCKGDTEPCPVASSSLTHEIAVCEGNAITWHPYVENACHCPEKGLFAVHTSQFGDVAQLQFGQCAEVQTDFLDYENRCGSTLPCTGSVDFSIDPNALSDTEELCYKQCAVLTALRVILAETCARFETGRRGER